MTATEPIESTRPHLHAVDGPDRIDEQAAERAIRDLLVALGRDPHDDHLTDTPRRVAGVYVELLSPRPFQLTTFPNEEGYDELIAFWLREGRVTAAMNVNVWDVVDDLRALVTAQAHIDPNRLRNPDVRSRSS